MYLEIKEKLLSLPMGIREKEEEVYLLKTDIEEKKLIKKTIFDLIYKDVFNVTNENNKPMYSNERSRDLEALRRSGKSEDYVRTAKEIKDKEEKLATETRNMDFMKRMHRSYVALTEM